MTEFTEVLSGTLQVNRSWGSQPSKNKWPDFYTLEEFSLKQENCHCQMVMEALLQQGDVNKDALSKANCYHSYRMLSIFK